MDDLSQPQERCLAAGAAPGGPQGPSGKLPGEEGRQVAGVARDEFWREFAQEVAVMVVSRHGDEFGNASAPTGGRAVSEQAQGRQQSSGPEECPPAHEAATPGKDTRQPALDDRLLVTHWPA